MATTKYVRTISAAPCTIVVSGNRHETVYQRTVFGDGYADNATSPKRFAFTDGGSYTESVDYTCTFDDPNLIFTGWFTLPWGTTKTGIATIADATRLVSQSPTISAHIIKLNCGTTDDGVFVCYPKVQRVQINYYPGAHGTGETITEYVTKSPLKLPGAKFVSQDYYVQDGWIDPEGNKREFGDSYSISTGTSLLGFSASWAKIPTSTVTLNMQGGSGGTASVIAGYGRAMPYATMPTRLGYTFGGYWTGIGGSGTKYYNADGSGARNWDISDTTVTLYAEWTANTYTVALNQNGGSGGTTSITATYDAAMPSAVMPTRTGWAFTGYYTASTGGTKYYNADGSSARNWDWTIDTTLYARWNEIIYLVLFDSAGGWIDDGSSFIYARYGRQLGSLPTPKWEGYTFVGWFTAKTGGTQVTAETTFSGTSDTTYYAHWVSAGDKKYFVSFIDPTGTNTTVTRQYQIGFWFSLLKIQSELGWTIPSGYSLNTDTAWTTSFSGGTKYADGQTVIDLAEEGYTTYLYALWNPQSHTVTFNYDGGKVIEPSRSVLHGNQIGRLPETIKNGIKSIGWKISGTQTQVTSTYIVTSNITLVPIWGESTNEEFWVVVRYNIDLVLNGGILSPDYVAKYSKGYSKALPTDSQITKDDYVFKGWYKDEALTDGPYTEVPKSSSGNVKYWARFIEQS